MRSFHGREGGLPFLFLWRDLRPTSTDTRDSSRKTPDTTAPTSHALAVIIEFQFKKQVENNAEKFRTKSGGLQYLRYEELHGTWHFLIINHGLETTRSEAFSGLINVFR